MSIDFSKVAVGERICFIKNPLHKSIRYYEIIYGEFVAVEMFGTSNNWKSITYQHILNLELYLNGDKNCLTERTIHHNEEYNPALGFKPV